MTGSLAYERLGLIRPDVFDSFDLASVPDEHRDRVAGLIPGPSHEPSDAIPWDGRYLMRKLPGGLRCMDAFGVEKNAGTFGFNVSLAGPTGSAKTMAPRAYAAAHGLPFAVVPVNGGIDPSAIWGDYVNDPIAGWVWHWSDHALVAIYGGIICIDEMNMMHGRVSAAFFEATDDRRVFTVPRLGSKVVPIHPSVQWFGTLNPGYDGTARLNQAFARRFRAPFHWNYDRDIETVLTGSEALVDFAFRVRALPEVRTDLSTDHLVSFVDHAAMVGMDYAIARLLAGFDETESGGIRRSFEMFSAGIQSELGVSA